MDAIPLMAPLRWKTLPMRFWQNASPGALNLTGSLTICMSLRALQTQLSPDAYGRGLGIRPRSGTHPGRTIPHSHLNRSTSPIVISFLVRS